jgi:hypothetical protein
VATFVFELALKAADALPANAASAIATVLIVNKS